MGMSITNQRAARMAWRRSAVCYLCGEPLPILDLEETPIRRNDPTINDDHVPPETLFAPADRANFPLLLRTHATCNGGESSNDQKMAELFRLIWNPKTEDDLQVLALEWESDSTERATASYWRGDDLPAIVFRWIRGFHHALYGEHLPLNTKRATLLPFLEMKPEGAVRPHQQYFDFARHIQRQRALDSLDQIIAYNGRLQYQCVWFTDGACSTCIYALDVNGWSVFSGGPAGSYRSAVGCYVTRSIPLGATTLSSIHFDPTMVTLDLFSEMRSRYIGTEKIRKSVSFRGGNFPQPSA
jgi:hypothetical protein